MVPPVIDNLGPEDDRDIGPYLPLLEELGVEILALNTGHVVCPGVAEHTTANADTDCVLYPNGGGFHFHCFHGSCSEARARESARLRAATRSGPLAGAHRESRKIESQQEHEHAMREAEVQLLAAVLQDYAWPASDIERDPVGGVGEPFEDHWAYLLGLFRPHDVVWIGRDIRDTGKPGHKWRFRTQEKWWRETVCPGAFICPNSFEVGVHNRRDDTVAERRFLVVESDVLKRDEVGAVFRFLESKSFGMRLRAVVDTGGKSLHGWFDCPAEKTLRQLRKVLPALKCDPSMLGASQPARLPGIIRAETGRWQRLIYFSPDDQE